MVDHMDIFVHLCIILNLFPSTNESTIMIAKAVLYKLLEIKPQ